MVFHWSLSCSKYPQVSRTLLSILAVLNNAVVWIVSTRPPTSKSSSPFNNPLFTVPKASIRIGIIVIFMFHSFFFFNSRKRSRYLSSFSHSFSFILWSAGTANSTILQILFFCCCWLLCDWCFSSVSPHSLHLLFWYVLSILSLIWLVLMALFCATIRRNSVFLLKFIFLAT